MSEQEQRARFEAQATPLANGRFEIVAITAGQGNGWNFGADVLRGSLSLWDGVDIYVNHLGLFDDNHKVQDLAGVAFGPLFDDAAQGVRLTLKTLGPSGPLLAAVGREVLADGAKPRLGFSADLSFKAQANDVQEITKIFSLDCVVNPARGGAFVRAIQSVGGWVRQEATMADAVVAVASPPPVAEAQTFGKELEAVRALLDTQREHQRIAQEVEAARTVRAQMCEYLLDSGLAASRLPVSMQAHVRTQFAGKVFEPSELNTAIEQARTLVSALVGGQAVRGGASHISQMFSTDDQLQARMDDMFEVPREKGAENLKVHRAGLRELYLMMTGDMDFHGWYDLERAQLQATTATFPGLVKNAMNKAVIEQWNLLGRAGYDWWKRVAHIEHFDNINQITWIIFGTVGALSTVAEGAEYTELKIGDSPETSSFTKYGNYVGVTIEAIMRDNMAKLRALPRALAAGALRNISTQCAAIFTQASGTGPTLTDGGALFNSTAVTTAGGHTNLLTTALSAAQIDVVQAAVYNQPMLIAQETGYYGTGKPMAIDPEFLLVPRALRLTAMKALSTKWDSAANVHSENVQYEGADKVVVVPDWTDATDWAMVVDPNIAPGLCIGEVFGLMPEIYLAGDPTSPAMFMNDESRIKVRHFLAVGVADFRPMHKENVAG